MAEFVRIVQVRSNGTERRIRDIPIASLTDPQVERAEAYAEARATWDAGQHIRVYTSSDEVISPGDLVWDSDVLYA